MIVTNANDWLAAHSERAYAALEPKRWEPTPIPKRVCEQCGADLSGYGKRASFCAACSRSRQAERNRVRRTPKLTVALDTERLVELVRSDPRSMRDLSVLMGASSSALDKMTRGETKCIRIDKANALAAALGVTVGEFTREEA
jgi:DNA-binding Xre family transcriptional regulator